MDKLYSINNIATMTGFTTRSLRTFINEGLLTGEKIDGAWQFTIEQYEAFISKPQIKASLQTKSNAVVYDFLGESKQNNAMCVVLDLKANTAEEVQEIMEYFCQSVPEDHYDKAGYCLDTKFQLKINREKEDIRVILKGNEEQIFEILKGWYK